MTPAPATVGQVRVVFSFKLSNHDIGKTDAVKIEDDMTVSYICSNSFFNGLIMGELPEACLPACVPAACLPA